MLEEPLRSAPERSGFNYRHKDHHNSAPEELGKMSETTAHDAIAQALETLEEAKSERTGGKWLERLTAQMAPLIKEWDILPLLDMVRMA